MRIAAILFWFAAPAGAFAPRRALENALPLIWRDWLDRTLTELARRLAGIIVTLALRDAALDERGRIRFIDPRAPRHYVVGARQIIGAGLRAALHGRTLIQRFERLLRVFAARAAYARRWRRRLHRGRTRLLAAHTRARDLAPANNLVPAAPTNPIHQDSS